MHLPRMRSGPDQGEATVFAEREQVLLTFYQRCKVKRASIGCTNERPYRRVVYHRVDRRCIASEGQQGQGLASKAK